MMNLKFAYPVYLFVLCVYPGFKEQNMSRDNRGLLGWEEIQKCSRCTYRYMYMYIDGKESGKRRRRAGTPLAMQERKETIKEQKYV